VTKSARLDREIAHALSKRMILPRYDARRGWIGGDTRTLYAFTDRRTGKVYAVRPGGGSGRHATVADVGGSEADVRIATRAEAERLWQSPLHAGWKVA
jgi:hypothetical protein